MVDFGIMDKYLRKYSSILGSVPQKSRTSRDLLRAEFLVVPFAFASASFAACAIVLVLEVAYHRMGSRKKLKMPS